MDTNRREHLVQWLGSPEQIPLTTIATGRLHELACGLGLDALGDDTDALHTSQLDDRAHRGLAVCSVNAIDE
ncbi:MAG: hypothetical protein ABIP21_09805 [Acidimicrobiia bacterium]